MVEQMNEEIDWDKCPPDWEDFPLSVHNAINIFHTLGSKVMPEIGYTGKDYTLLEPLLESYQIKEQIEKDWIFELLILLDSRTLEESQKAIKAEYDKIKRK